ncbi:hypothetical protein ACFWBB_08890 [Streptomyces sp. NPDC060000]|uniref:hypothetical protein n=1 Tax=Streptomyces sp. NPDC060000 TaxID=3347031 RepID=UPI00367A1EC8
MTTADSAGIGNKDIDNEVIRNEAGEVNEVGEPREVGGLGQVVDDDFMGDEVMGDRGMGDRGMEEKVMDHEVMDDAEASTGLGVSPTQLRLLVAASGWPALAATAVPGPSPLRWVPVLLFVLFGPGCAALYPQPGHLASGARLEAIALAAPISLSLGVLAATSLFLVKAFSMTAFLISLACFTTVTSALPGLPLPAARRGAVERARVRRSPSGGSDA